MLQFSTDGATLLWWFLTIHTFNEYFQPKHFLKGNNYDISLMDIVLIALIVYFSFNMRIILGLIIILTIHINKTARFTFPCACSDMNFFQYSFEFIYLFCIFNWVGKLNLIICFRVLFTFHWHSNENLRQVSRSVVKWL